MADFDSSVIHIRLFDGPRVCVDGQECSRFATRHAAAILTLLALNPTKRFTRDELADFLWPDEALYASRRRIREHLYQLRKAIPRGSELILSDNETIWLSDSLTFSVDALEFDRLTRIAGKTTDDQRKADLLIEAEELCAGVFTSDLDWPHFNAARTRYALLHLECLRALTALLADEKPETAIDYAVKAVAAEPLSEEAQEDLIKLYARAGRPDQARKQYRAFEKLLKKELGSEPSREIMEFVRKLPANGPEKPLPRLADGKRVSLANLLYLTFPWERKTRIYGAVAALSTLAALAVVCIAQPWRKPKASVPPLAPEKRIVRIRGLAAQISRTADPIRRNHLESKRATECLELAEEAWNAWWGPDEQAWVSLLNSVDDQIENSLLWLKQKDPPRQAQMAGALVRYWNFPEHRLRDKARWLWLARDNRRPIQDQYRARALIGLSRYYLLLTRENAGPGLNDARNALALYTKCGSKWGQAHALRYIALHEHHELQAVRAVADFHRALEIFRNIRDERGEAQTLECLSYVGPDNPGKPVTQLEMMTMRADASRLYRKIGNRLGCYETERGLCKEKLRAIGASGNPQVCALIKNELKQWAQYEEVRDDRMRLHAVWIALARIGLGSRDASLCAECLPHLWYSAPNEAYRGARETGRIFAACTKFSNLPLPDPHQMFDTRISENQVAFRRGLEEGQRMDIDQAVAFAASR